MTLRDDKSFPYILIAQGPSGRADRQASRARASHKGSYFGPFASAGAVNRTINALQKAFLLRSCSDSVYREPHAALPAPPDQALLGAVHRRDRAEAYGELVQRGGGLPRRQEQDGEGGTGAGRWRRRPRGSISSRRRAIATASRR